MSALAPNRLKDAETSRRGEALERGLEQRPHFYLLYILFYFAPWFFVPVTQADIIVGLLATSVFASVYVYAMGRGRRMLIIGAVFALALALGLTPFNGTTGTFAIYAVTLCASIRPDRHALIAMGLALLVYIVGSLFVRYGPPDTFVSLFEIGFTSFLCVMAGLAAWSGYNTSERVDLRERRLRLDAELAAARERERIARDLHDVLGHTLTTIAVKSDLAARLLGADDAAARREIEDIRDASRATLKEVRAAVAGMHRTTLPEEIERAVSALESIGITVKQTGKAPSLPSHQASALGMALREATTNVLRHAEAETVSIAWRTEGGIVETVFEDDGGATAPTPGAGLNGMRGRLESLGGTLDINSGAKGVQLVMRLPTDTALEATP